MRALHSLASFQFTSWLPFCHGEIGLVPRGWFSVNPRWLVVILSININLQICWRKITKAPNAKKIMPKAEKKYYFGSRRTNVFQQLAVQISVERGWCPELPSGRGYTDCQSQRVLKVLGGERWKPQESQRGDSLRTCTSSVPFPNRQVLPPSCLSPFCLQALEATLAFLIRQFGWETILFGLRDENKNVSNQNFHIWSQMIDGM